MLPDTRCRYHSFLSCNFFVKRFTLCYRTVVCPVCDIGELWPNGWTDQDETPQAGRPWPWSHCVRWVPMSPSRKGAEPPNFRPMCCGQLGQWIKMPLGRKVGLGPGHIVLDGDPASPTQRGGGHSPQFVAHVLWPNSRPYQLLQNTWFIFVMYCLYDFTVLIRVI